MRIYLQPRLSAVSKKVLILFKHTHFAGYQAQNHRPIVEFHIHVCAMEQLGFWTIATSDHCFSCLFGVKRVRSTEYWCADDERLLRVFWSHSPAARKYCGLISLSLWRFSGWTNSAVYCHLRLESHLSWPQGFIPPSSLFDARPSYASCSSLSCDPLLLSKIVIPYLRSLLVAGVLFGQTFAVSWRKGG